MCSYDVGKMKKKSALQILSVDSSHITVGQISSCNGTRRTAVHVHPRSSDLKPFILELRDSAAAFVERLTK